MILSVISTVFKSCAEFSHGLNRVAAGKPTLIAKPFKHSFGRMALLARAHFVLQQPLVNLIGKTIKPGPFDRGRPSIPRRLRIRQHLRNTVPADPKIPCYPAPAQPILKMNAPNLQIQIHGVNPQALPIIERA